MLRYSDSYAGAGQPLSAKQLNNLGQETQRLVAASKNLPAGVNEQVLVDYEIKRIDITAGSFLHILGSTNPYVSRLVPARGKIKGTGADVWVVGEGQKTLKKPYSNNLTATFAVANGTYTFDGVTLPYYQALRHDSELFFGTAFSGAIFSGTAGESGLPIYQDRLSPGKPSIADLGGPCLFWRYGDYGYLESFLGQRIVVEAIATRVGINWKASWLGSSGNRSVGFSSSYSNYGVKILARGKETDRFLVTLAFNPTDFNLDYPVIVGACLYNYYAPPYASYAHDPFQVEPPPTSPMATPI